MQKQHCFFFLLCQISVRRRRATVEKERWAWRNIARAGMESESKRQRKKPVLIMRLKIGQVAHTDTLLLGTWLWFIYFVCGKEPSTGHCIRGKPCAWPSGSLHVAKAAITAINKKNLSFCLFFQGVWTEKVYRVGFLAAGVSYTAQNHRKTMWCEMCKAPGQQRPVGQHCDRVQTVWTLSFSGIISDPRGVHISGLQQNKTWRLARLGLERNKRKGSLRTEWGRDERWSSGMLLNLLDAQLKTTESKA